MLEKVWASVTFENDFDLRINCCLKLMGIYRFITPVIL